MSNTDISNVINVALIPEGQLASRDNMNNVAIMTSELGFLSTANRSAQYSSLTGVANDFPTTSEVYEWASVLFASKPNPINSGGSLTVGFWRAASESVAATAGLLTSPQHSEDTLVGKMIEISDGSFSVSIDGGVAQDVTALDFRTVDSLDDIATILDTAITGAAVTIDDLKIVITSGTTGAASAVSLFTDGSTGTSIGAILALSVGTGAVVLDGSASTTLTAETKDAALNEVKKDINFKGVVFIDKLTDAEVTTISTWALATSTLVYETFSSLANLERDVTNAVWKNKLAKGTYFRMLFTKLNQRKLAVAKMARMHVVNFNGENTALTMHLKELSGIVAEEFTQSEVTKAKKVGLDIYTTIKNVSVLLQSGANDFTDNPYNIIAYIDAVQTDTFNLLKITGTKISQTEKGVNQLVDSIEKTNRGFVRAAVFAPGTWSSPDFFGNKETFDRSILANGFYVLAGQLSDQPQADRQARKSPVIQVAVKNAGAIHSADIIVNFNL